MRPAGNRQALLSELAVLDADRLRAGVQLIEPIAGGLRDHERVPASVAVRVGAFERDAFDAPAFLVRITCPRLR